MAAESAATPALAAHAAARRPPQVLPVARGQACPNKTFVSEWGDSLKQGSERVWAGYLQSSYSAGNEEVHGKVGAGGMYGRAAVLPGRCMELAPCPSPLHRVGGPVHHGTSSG